MLQLAATADAKMRAGRFNPPGRALQHLHKRHARRQGAVSPTAPSAPARQRLLNRDNHPLAWNADRHMQRLRQALIRLDCWRAGIGQSGNHLTNGLALTGEADQLHLIRANTRLLFQWQGHVSILSATRKS